MDSYISELLEDINIFLKDVEKDVKLAKQIKASICRTDKLAGMWKDRRVNGDKFCEIDGCTNIALFQETLCDPHDRRANRDYR